jgi:hypothetical protein
MAGAASDLHEGEGGVKINRFTTSDVISFGFVRHWLAWGPDWRWISMFIQDVPEAADIAKQILGRQEEVGADEALRELCVDLARHFNCVFLHDVDEKPIADIVEALKKLQPRTIKINQNRLRFN